MPAPEHANPETGGIDRYLFVPKVLDLATRGRTFRWVFTLVLRLVAVAVGLGALLSWIAIWKLASSLDPQGVVGLVLFQITFAVAAYAMVHTILIRAGDVASLAESEFVVIPIVSVCLRLVGECVAWMFTALAVGGSVLILFAGPYARYATEQLPLTGYLPGGSGLLGALFYAVGGLVTAFLALLFFYLLAETISVMTAIARNTDVIRKVAEGAERTSTREATLGA